LAIRDDGDGDGDNRSNDVTMQQYVDRSKSCASGFSQIIITTSLPINDT